MKLIIQNKIMDISTLTYRQLGFGERLVDVPTLGFELILTLCEFIVIMECPFNQFILELKDDDERTNYEDAISELVQYSYPDFMTLLEIDKTTLGRLIQRFLFFELLEGCLGKNSAALCSIAVNDIISISIGKEVVHILGEAYTINL